MARRYRKKMHRKPRRNAKAKYARSVPRSLGQFMPYNYRFKMLPQILKNDPATGSFVFAGAPAGFYPLIPSHLSLQGAATGFPNYFDIGLSARFRLSDLGNYSSFTSLYDAYKINRVSVTIESLSNVAAQNTTGVLPTIWQYYDQDDYITPAAAGPGTGIAQVLGKQGVKRHQFGSSKKASVTFSFSPTSQVVVENGLSDPADSLIAGQINKKPMWLNCATPDVNHYGFKAWITDMYSPIVSAENTAPTVALRFNWTYDISFRSPILNT